ncbi:MAG: UDP-2,3-diacylglucosamine diphosphatase [Chromatiales bacterium]|jgi:UDP-2,3-diacylglucosamine hydrolase
MTESLFISDLHLCDSRPAALTLFEKFIRGRARQAGNLFILGDLFDAWVGDDDDSQTATRVQQALRQLSENGTAVHIMHGNRDFLIGERFCQQSGASLLPDPFVLQEMPQPILLTHGDLLCTDDVNYQQARRMRTDPAWIEDFLARPLTERKLLAEQYRQQSGEAKSLLAVDIMDANEVTVLDFFRLYQVSFMIHGHTHRPATHEHRLGGKTAIRIVLAEWHDDLGMALSIDERMQPETLQIT